MGLSATVSGYFSRLRRTWFASANGIATPPPAPSPAPMTKPQPPPDHAWDHLSQEAAWSLVDAWFTIRVGGPINKQ